MIIVLSAADACCRPFNPLDRHTESLVDEIDVRLDDEHAFGAIRYAIAPYALGPTYLHRLIKFLRRAACSGLRDVCYGQMLDLGHALHRRR